MVRLAWTMVAAGIAAAVGAQAFPVISAGRIANSKEVETYRTWVRDYVERDRRHPRKRNHELRIPAALEEAIRKRSVEAKGAGMALPPPEDPSSPEVEPEVESHPPPSGVNPPEGADAERSFSHAISRSDRANGDTAGTGNAGDGGRPAGAEGNCEDGCKDERTRRRATRRAEKGDPANRPAEGESERPERSSQPADPDDPHVAGRPESDAGTVDVRVHDAVDSVAADVLIPAGVPGEQDTTASAPADVPDFGVLPEAPQWTYAQRWSPDQPKPPEPSPAPEDITAAAYLDVFGELPPQTPPQWKRFIDFERLPPPPPSAADTGDDTSDDTGGNTANTDVDADADAARFAGNKAYHVHRAVSEKRDAPLTRVKLTYYWLKSQEKGYDEGDTELRSCDGKTVFGTASKTFAEELRMEGTGFLLNGKVLNLGDCDCGDGTDTFNCFMDITNDRGAPFGYGVQNIPLRPFVSVANNDAIHKVGSVLYVPDLDGFKLPLGKVHNGCLQKVDHIGRGGKASHIDFFAVHEKIAMGYFDKKLKKNYLNVEWDAPRCVGKLLDYGVAPQG